MGIYRGAEKFDHQEKYSVNIKYNVRPARHWSREMRTMRTLIVTAGLAVLLTGCITVSEYKFSFNFSTGEVRHVYYDLTSRQGADEKGYSVENDWAMLRQMIGDKKPEFDPDVVEDISKELFEENTVLCAQKLQKVKCPKCFPSKAAILVQLHDKDWRFELINNEIFLFLPSGKKVISTNGQEITTAKNSVIVWPHETNKFEYVVSEQWSGGASLLPYYLKERNEEK